MGNTAIVGSVFYLDRISHCSWNSVLYPYFSLDDTLKWSFINYRYRIIVYNITVDSCMSILTVSILHSLAIR